MKLKPLVTLLLSLVLLTPHDDVFGRGRGGGGGGGMRGGGGGGGMRGGGGGGMSRGGGGMSRPSGGGGGGRPNMGGGGGQHANFGGGGGNRPNMGGGGSRPNIGGGNSIAGGANRPDFGGGNRPGIGEGNRPGIATRPGQGGAGERFPVTRPGQGGAGERFPGTRPGQGGAGERFPGNGNRPNIGNNTNIGNNVNFNNNRNNFINNGNSNFPVGGNNWNNDWHHGYWGGGNWGGGGYWGGGNAAAWGLAGYGAGYRNGYWNGYANSSWYRPWYSNPLVWGLGGWALGSVYYNSGYGYYNNPYYASGAGYYDYSQPIQVVAQPTQVVVQDSGQPGDPSAAPPSAVQASRTHLDAAQDAFKAGDYATAGAEIDLAINEQPTDAALHEFRALVYFATADYDKAAGALYAVLSAGPGWDWTTLSSLYPSVDDYTVQLRALEQYVKANRDAADAYFVLAYHYITASHKDAAIRQLQDVAKLQPSDQLTAQLIKGLGGEVPAQPGASPPPAAEDSSVAGKDQPPPPNIDPAKIVGHRTAKRPDGTTFTLDLTPDNKFTWAFERDGKKQEFGGTYTVDGAVLVLERDDKASMPGLVTMEDGGFNYKLFGAPQEDPGLDFKS